MLFHVGVAAGLPLILVCPSECSSVCPRFGPRVSAVRWPFPPCFIYKYLLNELLR